MNQYSNQPVYLIASERSGTNLLRRRLTACQKVYFGPAPAHFLKHLYFREPFYGDLSDDRCFSQLVGDAIDLSVVHFSPWKTSLTVEDVLCRFGRRPRNVVQLAHFLMTAHAQEVGYESYLCKDNQLYDFANAIASEVPEARFIYLFRDPRDFVLSQTRRPGSSASVLKYATLWRDEQLRSIRVASALASEGKCHFVSYELLLEDEDRVLDEICAFLGVAREAPRRVPEDSMSSPVHDWKNLSRTTMRDNHGKFLTQMPRSSIARIEVVCREPMQWLGYRAATTRTRAITPAELVVGRMLDAVAAIRARFLPKGTEQQRARSRLLKRLDVHRPGARF